jgi:hypothetical protein
MLQRKKCDRSLQAIAAGQAGVYGQIFRVRSTDTIVNVATPPGNAELDFVLLDIVHEGDIYPTIHLAISVS